MKHRLHSAVLALLAAASLAADAAPRASGPILTRQQAFVVPFRAADTLKDPARVEVELLVSRDGGATWQVQGQTTADRRGFKFRAAEDGPYAFAVRVRGSQFNEDDLAPPIGLRVVVDTTPPELSLDAAASEEDEITLKVRLADPQLDPATLKLEYRGAGQEAWQTVAMDPNRDADPKPAYTVNVRWWPTLPAASYAIRAEVRDRAGNPTVTQTQVAGRTAPVEEEAEADPPPADASPPAASGAPWPADEESDGLLLHHPRAGLDGAPPLGSASNDPFTRGRMRGQLVGRSIAPPADLPPDDGPPADAIADAAQPPADDDRPAPLVPPGDAPPKLDRAPLGVRPRMVNSRRFLLEYDVEAVGPSGIRKVELWGTRDGGQTWAALGSDDDNLSPLPVEVREEGLYGFRVLVQSGSGVVELAPRPGDTPEVWIGVDLTPPTGRITRVEQGAGERAGQVIVHYEAADDRPLDRPISLAFSSRPGGPWTTIASALRGTGRFVWQIEQSVGDEAWLRLEVRDEAGNVTVDEPAEPVSLARFRPRGRIRDVVPAR